MYIYIYEYLLICLFIYIYIYTYICMYVYIFSYVNISTSNDLQFSNKFSFYL